MGIFKNLFGKKSDPLEPLMPGTRISGLLKQQKAPMSAQRCDWCRSTYMNSDWMFTLLTNDPNQFALDVGGYCPQCAQTRCGHHAHLGKVERPELTRHKHEGMDGLIWGMLCDMCDTPMQQGPAGARGHAVLADGGLLSGGLLSR